MPDGWRFPFSFAIGNTLRKKSSEIDPAGSYAGWVYAALSKRAKRVANIKLEFFNMKRNGDLEQIDDHELLSLLYRANTMQSQFQFFYTIEMFLGIWGSAPIFMDKAGGAKIQYLWPLRPDLLRTVMNAEGQVTGYEYRLSSKMTTFSREEVLMINEPNPQSIMLGFSPVGAASLEIDTDMAAALWNKHLVDNWAEPGGVLSTENELTDETYERLRKQWNVRQQGPLNAGRYALLENGLKWEAVGRSPKEMEHVESRRFHRNAIVTILGVPMGLMTSEDVNLANAEVAERVFNRDTIEPQMRLITSQMNEFLVPLYGDTLWIDFESPIPDDVQMKINQATAGEGKWLTVNEARELFNLPPLEGGDAIFKPIGVWPQVGDGATDPASQFGQLSKGYEKIEVGKLAKENPKHRLIKQAIKARNHMKQKAVKGIGEKVYDILAQKTKDAKHGAIKVSVKDGKAKSQPEKKSDDELDPRLKADRIEYLAKLPRAQREAKKRMRLFFNEQQKEVLGNLESEGLPKSAPGFKANFERWIKKILFDAGEWDETIKSLSVDMSKSNVAAGAAAIAELLGVDPSEILSSPHVLKFTEERSFVMLDVNKTTRDELRATLQEGLATGEDLGQLRNRIENTYNEARTFRAERIARTEVGSAQQFGRSEEMKAQKVQKQVWVATFSNTRDAHAEADGQVVEVGERFMVGGELLEYPGDFAGSPGNTINCQCSIAPTLSD